MGPDMNAFVLESIKAGTAVPESMRPMIEAMIASGQLLDENGVAFGSLEDAGVTFAQSVTEQFSTLLTKLDEFIAALTGVKPPPIHIPVTYDYPGNRPPPPDGGDGVPGLATGGVVTSPTLAVVGESGPEAVVPLDQWSGGGSSGPASATFGAGQMAMLQSALTRAIRDALLQAN
jgi:hypothetical protein